jgi:hypothetical protein
MKGNLAMRLVLGKSYLWLFWIVFAAFVVLVFGPVVFKLQPQVYAIVLLPLEMGLILVSEIRSGVALDSWWRAKYARGTWQYKALVAWHSFALIVFTVMAIVFLELWSAVEWPR